MLARANSTFIFCGTPYEFASSMSNSPAPASPANPPVGRIFKTAAGLLLAFLALQIAVAAFHFLPGVQQRLVKMFSQPAEGGAAPAAEPAPAAETSASAKESQQQAAAEAAPVDEALANRVKVLVSDSDKAFRIGDFDLGISKIQEAGKLVPGDPGILLRLARLQEKMGKPAEALATYRGVLALPNLPAELRAQTERKIATIRIPEAQTGPVVEAAAEGADARDEFGLQPGASLGIVDTRLAAGPGAAKTLRISIKSRPDLRVDPRQMAVHVFFYDRDASGNVQLTESQIQTEWASPPVNWSENEPELLNAIYNPPAGAGGSGTAEYAGYVVGIYYNGELQDTRAEPGSLAREHPLPIYLQSKQP